MRAVLLITAIFWTGASLQVAAEPVLRTVFAAHRLTTTQASHSIPVVLTGTVTTTMPEWDGFSFQDKTDAIYVGSSLPIAKTLKSGQRLRITGYSSPGNFAPTVTATAIDVLGSGPLPAPVPADWKVLSSGACDNNFVSVSGVVRSAELLVPSLWRWPSFGLHMDLGGNMVWAYVRDPGALSADALVNSDVRVNGVCIVLANSRRQFERNALLVPGSSDITIVKRSSQAVFDAPLRRIDRLFGFLSDVESLHRVMVKGVITWSSEHRAAVQDGSTALLLQSVSPLHIRPGDHVDAVGFPTAGVYSILLDNAVVRVTSIGAAVPPLTMAAANILDGPDRDHPGSPDALLVRVAGILIEQSRSAHEQVLVLQDGKTTFAARLSALHGEGLRVPLSMGSRLAVTGVCSIQVDEQGQPHSFELLLRTPGDIRLLARPPWLNVTVAVRAAVVLGAVLLASAVWLILLRRRIDTQRRMIRIQFAREATLEKRFRELVANASDMVYIRNEEGRFLHVNRGAEQITGYSAAELLQMKIQDLAVPNEREENCFHITLPTNGDADLPTVECRILTKDARELTLEIKRRMFREEDGTACIECIGRDITARRQALNDNLERFHTLADNIAQLAWIADRTGFIFWFNQRWFEYTGLTLEQSRGWQWENVHHPDHLDRVLARIRYCFAHGEPWDDTFPLRGADGEYRWFLGHAIPIRDRSGQVLRWFGTNTDITEQKQIESELQRSNQDLQQFAYVASHDLQEPLRNISIFADLLQRSFANGDLTPRRQQYLEVVTAGARRMERLITDLLDYSRVAAGPSANKTAVNLESVLAESLENLAAAIRESGAEITHTLLPAIEANPSQIQQVLQNLIANSLKYRREGVPPRIHVSASRKRDEWLFRIEDNGRGFDPLYNEKVFGIFKRLHGSDVPGTGIGLAICKTVIETHGGHIWAEGAPGEGATFYFTLPVSKMVLS